MLPCPSFLILSFFGEKVLGCLISIAIAYHKILETLVCTKNWLKASPTPLASKENIEDINKIDRGEIKRYI